MSKNDDSVIDILANIRNFISKEPKDLPENNEDVLELTDVMESDGQVVSISEKSDQSEDLGTGIFQTIDNAIGEINMSSKKKEGSKAAKNSKKEAEKSSDLKQEQELCKTKKGENNDSISSENGEDAIMSGSSISELRNLIKSVKNQDSDNNANNESSSNFMEEFVASLVRPMLKDWMEKNLKDMVEKILEKEIKNILK